MRCTHRVIPPLNKDLLWIRQGTLTRENGAWFSTRPLFPSFQRFLYGEYDIELESQVKMQLGEQRTPMKNINFSTLPLDITKA
jgi:hypothetical protein